MRSEYVEDVKSRFPNGHGPSVLPTEKAKMQAALDDKKAEWELVRVLQANKEIGPFGCLRRQRACVRPCLRMCLLSCVRSLRLSLKSIICGQVGPTSGTLVFLVCLDAGMVLVLDSFLFLSLSVIVCAMVCAT